MRWVTPEDAVIDLAALARPTEVNDQSRRNLVATLAFLSLPPTEPELRMLHRAFDHWRGIGIFASALYQVGYDLTLSRHGPRRQVAPSASLTG